MQRREFNRMIGYGAITLPILPVLQKNKVLLFSNVTQKVPIGVCNHSLRGLRPTAEQLMDYAIEQNLESVLLNTFQPLKSLDTKYLVSLRKYANSNNVSIYIGAGSISKTSPRFSDKYVSPEELLKEGIRVATLVGSPIVGCRIGNYEDRYLDGGIEAQIESVIRVMKSVRIQAQDSGLKFAFENHAGDMRSRELLALINETGNDICGALFDPANAVWALEDPMIAFSNLADKIICTSVRDIQVWETGEGAVFQGTAIGEGLMDYQYYTKTMSELNPGVPLHIETISNTARSVPFLKPDFWRGFPDLPASELIPFLNLIKRGSPLQIIEPPEGMDKKVFDIELQRSELQKSIEYLREIG